MATLDEEVRACNRQGIDLAYQGRLDEAADCFRQALRLQPDSPAGHNNLGNILCWQGQLLEAATCYRAALKLLPDDPATLNNLGNTLRQLGDLDEAVTYGRRALSLQDGYAEAHSNLGIALQAKGELDEALFHCQRAIQLRPDFPEAYNNLGMVLREMGRLDEAVAACHESLRLRPGYAEAYNNLGNALVQQGRWDEAETTFQQALVARPDLAEARVSLASCYWRQDKLDEACALCEEALRQRPKMAAAHNILGAVCLKRGQFDEALVRLDQALCLDPDLAEGHFNRALVQLHLGNFQEGWLEYEWRWKCKDFVIHAPQRAFWDGSPLAERHILLCSEQGLGDTLQFIRYAPLVKQLGANVTMACPRVLLPLLGRCPGIDRLVAQEDVLPECDTHSPLLNLPAIFGTTLATIPKSVPYLFADQSLVGHWRRELAAVAGFKVGIAWKGNSKHPFDRYRSMPLTCFGVLAQPGVTLLSLQKGEGLEQLDALGGRFAVVDLGRRLDETAGAFMDTAAVMKNLDLVITSDTSIAHLAGGLGVPVWVALPFVPDWRWLLDRDDSPWYPTMRLFRQRIPGGWEDVFARLAAELSRLVGQRSARR